MTDPEGMEELGYVRAVAGGHVHVGAELVEPANNGPEELDVRRVVDVDPDFQATSVACEGTSCRTVVPCAVSPAATVMARHIQAVTHRVNSRSSLRPRRTR